MPQPQPHPAPWWWCPPPPQAPASAAGHPAAQPGADAARGENAESCRSSRSDPHPGHDGFSPARSSVSKARPHALQTYSRNGIPAPYASAACNASMSTFAWRNPTNSAFFCPSLKTSRYGMVFTP